MPRKLRSVDSPNKLNAPSPPTPTPSGFDADLNVVVCLGELVGDPQTRELESGSRLVTISLTIRSDGDPVTSLPLVVFDPSKRLEATLNSGGRVVVTGRVSRRFFRTPGGTQSRTELVVSRLEPARRTVAVTKMLDEATKRVLALIADADRPGAA